LAAELGLPRGTLQSYLTDPDRPRHRRISPVADDRLRRLAARHGIDTTLPPSPRAVTTDSNPAEQGLSREEARQRNDAAYHCFLKDRFYDLGDVALVLEEEERRVRTRLEEQASGPAAKAVLARMLEGLRRHRDEVRRSIGQVYDQINRRKAGGRQPPW
jgi:hypothetical protein